MADEAHRGQYGFDEKIIIKENEQGEKEAHTGHWKCPESSMMPCRMQPT